MKAATLIRTGSGPVQSHLVPGSPKLSLSRRNSFSGDKAVPNSPRISLHLDRKLAKTTIRRALSDSDVFQSPSRLSSVGSLKFPAIIPEEEYLSDADDDSNFETANRAGFWPGIGIPVDEFGQSGGGFGKGRKPGDGGRDGNGDRSKIGDYYQDMLKSNPGDPLLLRNYGKYLHEVEKDTVRAEEYYGRAILASPGDGELLSLYGKLIWETQRDGDRAKAYFDQAVHVSPNDCSVLGSYAHFMWEAEDDEDEGEEMSARASQSRMVAVCCST